MKSKHIQRNALVDVATINTDHLPPGVRRVIRENQDQGTPVKRIQVRVPVKTMARWMVIGGRFFRWVNSSEVIDGKKLHRVKLFCDGAQVTHRTTSMPDPLGYVRLHPRSALRTSLINQIRGDAGLTEDEAVELLAAPMRPF